jgi:hypothetical protein
VLDLVLAPLHYRLLTWRPIDHAYVDRVVTAVLHGSCPDPLHDTLRVAGTGSSCDPATARGMTPV